MFMNNRGQKLSIPISAVVKKVKEMNKHAAVVRKNLNNTLPYLLEYKRVLIQMKLLIK